MNNSNKTDGSSESLPIRRRNTQGLKTVTVSISIPIELNEFLNNQAEVEHKAKSLVATELMQQAVKENQ